MDALFLGGMSPRNKQWLHQVHDAFSPLFETTVVHEYKHWDDASLPMDLPGELAAAAEKAKDLGEYVIFAKSIGTVLAMQGIHDGILAPTACLLAGLPLDFIVRNSTPIATWLTNNPVSVTIVQNSNDPAGSFADVRAYLSARKPNQQLLELPGDTHDYTDLPKLKKLMTQLVFA